MTEKSLPQPSSPVQRSRTFTPYVLIWAALAVLSLIYLGLLATQPALVAGLLGGSRSAETDAKATEEALTKTAAEVRTLRDTIDLFRNELIEIRAQVSSQADAARDLTTRIAALEAEPAAAEEVAKAPPGKDAKQAAKTAAKGKGPEPAEQTAMAAPAQKAADAARKDAKKAAKSLETGSVAQPGAGAITFGAPTVTPAAVPPPAGKLFGVQIATGPSVDSLRLSWTLLNERHGDSFRSLEPRYTTNASGPEQSYDLVVGPLANPDDARQLCQELALKATPCTVTRFTGDAL